MADQLASALRPWVAGDLPVRLRAWDGSQAGPADAPLVQVRTPDALRRLIWRPGELGAAQAYVTGELEVHHDLGDALTHVRQVAAERGLRGVRPTPARLVTVVGRTLRTAWRLGALRPPPPAPRSQARVRGLLHSRPRDRRAIGHHYDLSNAFYALILDSGMAYSCGYWTSDDPEYGLDQAQQDKLDLVCRKLGLQPGMRLLDVGCGWGSLSLHAAERFGAQVTAVTISAEQRRYVEACIAERGLATRVAVRLQDYRDVDDEPYDAIGSLEMGEHVGRSHYPGYVAMLRRSVRPGGRVLIQQMSRGLGGRNDHPGGGPFIERFIAPDMHMRPVGETVSLLEHGGLEVRDVQALREHYVRTVEAWTARFEANLEELRQIVPEEVIRVWRLYLAGGRLAFRDGRMGVDQILTTRPGVSYAPSAGPAR